MELEQLKKLLAKPIENRLTTDINELIRITMNWNFTLSYATSKIHYETCRNAELKTFIAENTIYHSQDNKKENYIILSGTANLYECIQEGEKSILNFIKLLKAGDSFGQYDCKLSVENNNEEDLPKNFLIISNDLIEVCLLKESEIKLKSPKNEDILKKETNQVTFDPEVFLIDDPSKLYKTIDNVKEKVDEEFKVFNKYNQSLEDLKKDKEVKFINLILI